MEYDRQRTPGFYWIRFEGQLVIAEYTRRCPQRRPHWHIPGSGACFMDPQICELISVAPLPSPRLIGGQRVYEQHDAIDEEAVSSGG